MNPAESSGRPPVGEPDSAPDREPDREPDRALRPEVPPDSMARPWRNPRRLALQLLGFLAGIALLAVCIHGAWPRDEAARAGWATLRDASPWLVLAMLACTLGSSVVNGLSFHVTGRPVGPVGAWDLQRLNLVANLLNYAPVRLGLLGRVAWHLTVDRFGLVSIGGWFAVVGVVLVISVGSATAATLARPGLDALWLVLLVGMVAVGLLMLRGAGSVVLRRHGRDVDRILQAPGVLWMAAGLRLADVALYWARMAVASAVLGLDFSGGQLLMLAITAYAGSLAPFGRVGFREFLVAAAAGWIGLESGELDARMAQLALLESAGEFAFYLLGGAAVLPWYRRRMAAATAARRAEPREAAA
jgi:hypothetical protein